MLTNKFTDSCVQAENKQCFPLETGWTGVNRKTEVMRTIIVCLWFTTCHFPHLCTSVLLSGCCRSHRLGNSSAP